MTIILMRAATSATQAIRSDGIKIEPEVVGRLIAVGLLGPAVRRLEDAVRLKVPFAHDPANFDDGTTIMPWTNRPHEDAMIDMAKKYLRRSVKLDESPDEISLEFKAQRVVMHVKEHLISHGVNVYTQMWLFNPGIALNARLDLLRSMAHPNFGPSSATTAIAVGRMPALPAYSVTEWVRLLDSSWRNVGFAVPDRDLKVWIEKCEPDIVEFPAPNIVAGKFCRSDRFYENNAGQGIELGLGFFMVKKDEIYDQYHVVTPYIYNRRNTGQTEVSSYTKSYMFSSYRNNSKAYKQLDDLLSVPKRKNIVRLQTCSKCGAIFSSERLDLSHATCVR